jgi:hypothetical protein
MIALVILVLGILVSTSPALIAWRRGIETGTQGWLSRR